MVKIARIRIGEYKGARIRLEPGEILTAEDLNRLDSDIVSLVIDAGTYDPVTGNVIGGTDPVDINILSELSIPIVRLTIGGYFVYNIPDLSKWTALRTLTVMNTSVELLDNSVYELDLIQLRLQNNYRMTGLDTDLNYMSSLQVLELIEMPVDLTTWITSDNTLNNLSTLSVTDMPSVLELPDLSLLPSVESLYIERTGIVVTDEDIDDLADNTSLTFLSLNPDQIDFDVDYAQNDRGITVNVVVDDEY